MKNAIVFELLTLNQLMNLKQVLKMVQITIQVNKVQRYFGFGFGVHCSH